MEAPKKKRKRKKGFRPGTPFNALCKTARNATREPGFIVPDPLATSPNGEWRSRGCPQPFFSSGAATTRTFRRTKTTTKKRQQEEDNEMENRRRGEGWCRIAQRMDGWKERERARTDQPSPLVSPGRAAGAAAGRLTPPLANRGHARRSEASTCRSKALIVIVPYKKKKKERSCRARLVC